MKKTLYFGNRFQSALRGFHQSRRRRTADKLALAAAAPVVSEFETLENRILLSSIGTGLNKRQVTFLDADGDKVTVKALGKGAAFNIDLGGSTSDADIANIEIAKNGTSLGVTVAPVGSFTAPVQTKVIFNPNWDLSKLGGNSDLSLDGLTESQKIQTQYFNLTPGYTNIGSITAAPGVTQVGSIGLTAAVVPVIDLAGVAVGNINLSTGMVGKVDAFMATNGSFLPGYGGWTPGLHNINLYDINAKSIAGINIAGINPALYNAALSSSATGSPSVATISPLFTGNNYLGIITTDGGGSAGGIGRLTGTNSAFLGQISLNGANDFLGNTVINSWGSSAIISAAGNLTFTAKSFGGVLDVGGHLNIAFIDGFSGTIDAKGGVSGLRVATNDAIIVSNGIYGGQLLSEGNVADVILNNASFSGGTIEAANIGTIRFEGSFSSPLMAESGHPDHSGAILASGDIKGLVVRNADLTLGQGNLLVSAGGTLGLLSIANGDVGGSLSSGAIGEILVRGGNLDASIVATKGGIGNVNIDLGRLTGTLFAGAGDIGDVTVLADSSHAAISGSIIAQTGSIGAINATNIGGGMAIGGTPGYYTYFYSDYGYYQYGSYTPSKPVTIFAQQDIKSITATSTGATALGLSNISALGTLGPISVTAFGEGSDDYYGSGAIENVTLVAPTLGDITATSLAGTAIYGSTFISTTGAIGSITGTGRTGGLEGVTVNSATDIGTITGTATAQGSGISHSTFAAQGGNIGKVTGITTANDNYGFGIVSASISASGNIGDVTGTAFSGTGISGGSVTSVGGDIANITGKSTDILGRGDGIEGLSVIALGGSIGNITGQANGVDPGYYFFRTFASGLANLTVQALEGIGSIKGSAAQNGDGITGGSFTVAGASGNITEVIGSTSSGIGISGGASFNAYGGTIGSIVATPTGPSGQAVNNASFTAASLGNLSFVVANLAGGDAVTGLTATALTGDIGSITVTNDSVRDGSHGLANSSIEARRGNIGAITVTTAGGTGSFGIGATDVSAAGNIGAISVITTGRASDGITGGSTFEADADISGAGNIASVFVEVRGIGSNGISAVNQTGATFDAQNITGTGSGGNSIEVRVTSPEGGTAISGSSLLVDAAGDVGTIVVSNSSKLTGSNGVQGVTIKVEGSLAAVTATTVGGSAISGATFDVGGNIASLSATAKDGDAIANSTIEADGNIGTVTATSTKGTALYSTDFEAKGNIGNISAISQGAETGDSIRFGEFTAGGNIGTITAQAVGGDAIAGSTFEAKGNIGNIAATSTKGDAIFRSDFTADVDGNKSGDLGNITATTETGRAIAGVPGYYYGTFSTFSGANIGNISATVSGEDGQDAIFYATFTATAGNIGTVTASTASTNAAFDAVESGYFYATGNIGNIDLQATAGDAIFFAGFFADTDGAGGGAIGTIDATSDTGRGIVGGIFIGASIGDISAAVNEGGGNAIDRSFFSATGRIGNVSATADGGSAIFDSDFFADTDGDGAGDLGNITATSATGTGIAGRGYVLDPYFGYYADFSTFSGANIGNIEASVSDEGGYDAIRFATFTASAGSIGTVTASTVSTNAAFDAIDSSYFYATGNIGNIQATAVAGDALFLGGFYADSDGDGTGAIGNVQAVSESGQAIVGTGFNGASIGNIQATVTGEDGGSAISGAAFRASAGNIGTVSANTSGAGYGANAISYGTFLASGDIGAISATADGGRGIVGTTFQAGDNFFDPTATNIGNIGDVTVSSQGRDAINYSVFRASGNIGAVSATTGGDFARAINSSTFAAGFDFGVTTPPTAGSIGSINANATGEGGAAVLFSSFTALGTVGNIIGSGAAGSWLNIDSPTVGRITFSGMEAGNTARIIFDNIASQTTAVGAVFVNQNLEVSGWENLTRLGSVGVTNAITVNGGLTGLFFASANIGSNADGLRLQGSTANNGNAVLGGAFHDVVFNIDNTPPPALYTGNFNINGTLYTDKFLAPFDGTPVNGVTVNLI